MCVLLRVSASVEENFGMSWDFVLRGNDYLESCRSGCSVVVLVLGMMLRDERVLLCSNRSGRVVLLHHFSSFVFLNLLCCDRYWYESRSLSCQKEAYRAPFQIVFPSCLLCGRSLFCRLCGSTDALRVCLSLLRPATSERNFTDDVSKVPLFFET